MSQSQTLTRTQDIHWFWDEMDGDVRSTLTPEQRIAIEEAVKKTAAQTQPADLRLYLGKYFVRIIAGKERRNAERQKQDLKNNPIFTAKNAPVIAIFWVLMLFTTLYGLALILNLFA